MINKKIKEISHKNCSSCETKYSVEWDINIQDLEPMTCPFCGYAVELEDDEEDRIENIDREETFNEDPEDDSWN